MTHNTQTHSRLAQDYNDTPYTSFVFPACQPTRLHALAKIKGLNPPPIETAKILEIGCSFGGNLLPFAIRYPNSQIIGIDLSEHQINVGQQMFEEMGIKNVELVAADISQVSFNLKFDYIICHGVFSWVPEFVQSAILSVIQNYLVENGIAYISYNTYPGWKFKDIGKDLMLFGSDISQPSTERVKQGFDILELTRQTLGNQQSILAKTLEKFTQGRKAESQTYIAHEYFEEYNQPFYFKEFVHKLGQYELAYLTDASKPAFFYASDFGSNEQAEKICQYFQFNLEDIEQYFDFITAREFRGSVITHRQNKMDSGITNHIEQYQLCYHFYDLYLFAAAQFKHADEQLPARWELHYQNHISSTPQNDALFHYLQEQNVPCKIQDIFDYLANLECYNEADLIHTLWNLIHLAGSYICFAPEPNQTYGKKPKLAEKYATLMHIVHHNHGITSLSNRYYQRVDADFLMNYLFPLLDGSRTVTNLVKQLRQDIEEGAIIISENHQKRESKDIKDKDIKSLVIRCLDTLQNYGYFNQYD